MERDPPSHLIYKALDVCVLFFLRLLFSVFTFRKTSFLLVSCLRINEKLSYIAST